MSHAGSAAIRPDAGVLRRPWRNDPRTPLGVAAACVIALVLVWLVAELVPAAQFRDAVALNDFIAAAGPRVNGVANALVHTLRPPLMLVWGAALVCIALARGRPRLALAVVVVIGGASLSTEILKPLLAHPHVQLGAARVGAASWPSGHSTAALSVALAAVLVTPRRLRPVMLAPALAFAAAVGAALLALDMHMPSDVLGGYLMATLWAALAVAALRIAERRWPSRARPVKALQASDR